MILYHRKDYQTISATSLTTMRMGFASNFSTVSGNKKVGQMILMTPSNCISILVQKIRKNLKTSNFTKNFPETGKGDGGAIDTVWGFPDSSVGKESTCNAGNPGSIPKICQRRKGYPLQYSGLENSMNCVVHGMAKSQT